MIDLLIDRSVSIYHQLLVYCFKVLANTVWQTCYLQLVILICDKIQEKCNRKSELFQARCPWDKGTVHCSGKHTECGSW